MALKRRLSAEVEFAKRRLQAALAQVPFFFCFFFGQMPVSP
jgi:hypothetical protein